MRDCVVCSSCHSVNVGVIVLGGVPCVTVCVCVGAQGIPRARLEFILRRIGRPTHGQRSRLERDFQEYLDELSILIETKQYAHQRYRDSQMGKAGAVYSFGSNHYGQLGVGDKWPCAYEPLIVESLSSLGIRAVSAAPDGRTAYAVSCMGTVGRRWDGIGWID